MEDFVLQLIHDFKELADEHLGTADNEYIWALGAGDAEATKCHLANMEQHKQLAHMYQKMSYNAYSIVEQFMEADEK